jgi:hypothetical protein
MDNGDLFGIEDVSTAISQCVIAVGGRKHAASLLWPAMPLDEAAQKLDRCLNPRKRDVLHVEEFLLLIREARQKGCLIGVGYVNDYCDCAPPVPISPDDEEAELQRAFIRAQEDMQALVERMETLSKRRAVAGVVRPGRAA